MVLTITELKEELEQSTRKNRELSETNRQSMKEYTKLKMQYEKVMSKSTIANSYNKAGITGSSTTVPSTTYVQQQQTYLGGHQQQYGAPVAGNGRTAVRVEPPRYPLRIKRQTNTDALDTCRLRQAELSNLPYSPLIIEDRSTTTKMYQWTTQIFVQ
jgi:hypothetical protein